MVSKAFLAELEKLKEKAVFLKSSLNETLEANKKKDAEYTDSKKQFQKEIRQMTSEQNCLEQKLSVLESQILEYELKFKGSLPEQEKREIEFNDYNFELSRIREEIGHLDKKYEKVIQNLTEELNNAKAQLKEELRLEKQLEKNFCAILKSKKDEIEERVKKQKNGFEERFLKMEEKHNIRMDPLLYRLGCLDNDLSAAEAELEQKPKDLENLVKENKELEKKYEKAIEAKLMDESVLFADALVKGLKYLKNRSEALTSDATLGVLVVRANLQWIYNKLPHNNSLSKKLESLIKQCNDIINLNKTEYYPILRETVWNSETEDLKWGNFNVENYKHLLPKFNSCENIDSYVMEGTPEDSDFCINELIRTECEVSENCWFSETNKLHHSGYKTTHRLLYFLIATQLRCEKKNANKFLRIKMLKHNLCQRMLAEAKALFEEPHFALTKDLFLEDIALCGLEGYQEFAPRVWRKTVRSWQNFEGCFGYDVDLRHCQINTFQEVNIKSKVKRTNRAMDGCHSHLTAVALSSLAFFLRCAVKEISILL